MYLLSILQNHPLTVSGASLSAVFLTLLEALTPFLQFVALLLAIAIAAVTLLLKWNEYRLSRMEVDKMEVNNLEVNEDGNP